MIMMSSRSMISVKTLPLNRDRKDTMIPRAARTSDIVHAHPLPNHNPQANPKYSNPMTRTTTPMNDAMPPRNRCIPNPRCTNAPNAKSAMPPTKHRIACRMWRMAKRLIPNGRLTATICWISFAEAMLKQITLANIPYASLAAPRPAMS